MNQSLTDRYDEQFGGILSWTPKKNIPKAGVQCCCALRSYLGGAGMEGARKMIAHQILNLANIQISGPGMMEVMLESDRVPLRAGRPPIRFEPPPKEAALNGRHSPDDMILPPPFQQYPPAAPAAKPTRAPRRPSGRRTTRTPEPE